MYCILLVVVRLHIKQKFYYGLSLGTSTSLIF